ncbi:MAG: FMN-binding protein [Leptotrichiaceae bacterium]|nr:FMN-binding protein [Leptotrichiaceae bacterium]
MKKSLYLSLFLAIVSIVSAFVLSITNSLTKETIKNASIAKQNRKLETMFNKNTKFTEETVSGNSEIIETIFKAEENGKISGYIYSIKTKGYGGKIRFLLAVTPDGKYKAFNSLEHNETPGFGTKMDEETYKSQFEKKSISDDIDGISGATVTSKGLDKGIKEAVMHFEKNYKQEDRK